MSHRATSFLTTLAVATLIAASLPTLAAAAPPQLDDVSWETIGQEVRFTLVFSNPGPDPFTDAVPGELNSQEFGAFLGNVGQICSFDIPQIASGESHTVQCTVPLSSWPASAETRLPAAKADTGELIDAPCPPNTFWNGNVDVLWGPPGQ
jgi:uncharacterized repeat protein (TIGR01451 family)